MRPAEACEEGVHLTGEHASIWLGVTEVERAHGASDEMIEPAHLDEVARFLSAPSAHEQRQRSVLSRILILLAGSGGGMRWVAAPLREIEGALPQRRVLEEIPARDGRALKARSLRGRRPC
jgi:hypothetical protein